jgi:2-dehydro-3-deoxyphosphogluconate aldolase/(4S)-4-hydroxy-2-oxoglutarate aldolase
MTDALTGIRELRVVPVIVIDDPDDAGPVAEALLEGGLPCAEITFRTEAAAEAMTRIARGYPEMLVGAGTVLTPAQADAARDAGADFVLTPGFSPKVVDRCLEIGMPVFPGVSTPTDIEAALERGLTTLKFFPAEPLGMSYLKALSGPYRGVEFIPTGGINAVNLAAWLALPCVVACGGSWLVPSDRIRARDFDHVRREVVEAVRIIDSHPAV